VCLLTCCTSRVVYDASAAHALPSVNSVNINTASIAELEKLPYIGRRTAEKIIQFREENGPFHRVEHIMQIRGLSERRFAELRPFLKTE
jgi:competence protein ComEA